MKGKDLQAGDIIVSRDHNGRIYETDMLQEIDDNLTVRRAYVIRQWPSEPTRLMRGYGTDLLVRYIGSDSDLEVVR